MKIADLAISITALDATGRVYGNFINNSKRAWAEVKKLNDQGKTFQAWVKGASKVGTYAGMAAGGIMGAFGVHNKINQLADAQEGFNKVRALTGKGEAEMAEFRKKIYGIASDTGRSTEEILSGAMSKLRSGMADSDIFATLRNEGTYATATFSENMGDISAATLAMKRRTGRSRPPTQ